MRHRLGAALGMTLDRHRKLAAASLAVLLAAGCQSTTYRSYTDPKEDRIPLIDREVTYWLSDTIQFSPAKCAVVLPPKDESPDSVARLAGPALARYLGGRLPRVIGPLERRRLERRHGLQLSEQRARRLFADVTTCETYLSWRVLVSEEDYFLVWSQRRLRIEAALYRARDDRLLWQAVHTGRRSDGSVPLSPLSLPLAIFDATNLKADADVLPSMTDDVIRRMIVTLPDMR